MKMTQTVTRVTGVALAMAAAGWAFAAAGQNTDRPAGAAGHETAAPVRFHHEMQPLMRELSQAIDRMAAEMGRPGSREAQKAMAVRMQELSGMLGRMSGLLARPAHGAEERGQMAEMRSRLTALAQPALADASAARVDERMAELEAQLDQLDAQMQRIRASTDAAERSRLLGEHARALRRTTAQVRELNGVFRPQMRAMMGGGRGTVSAESMMRAHDLLARRIALMERLTAQVMEQSMGHQEAAPSGQGRGD